MNKEEDSYDAKNVSEIEVKQGGVYTVLAVKVTVTLYKRLINTEPLQIMYQHWPHVSEPWDWCGENYPVHTVHPWQYPHPVVGATVLRHHCRRDYVQYHGTRVLIQSGQYISRSCSVSQD